ncbi:unnamed protein product [Closterium sp. NIES-53]
MTRGLASGHASCIHVPGDGGLGTAGRMQQQRSHETPSPQQLREWYAGRQGSGGSGPCTYVLRTGDRSGEQYGGLHATQRCFGRLTDAWCAQFPDATEIPRWHDLLRSGVAIFDLDFDAILAAMYAVSNSAEGDCYVCVPLDPGVEAAALGASESAAPGARESAALGAGASALSGTASAQVFHTFTLNSGASRSFFRDRTTLTPLSRPVAVSLADPSGGPVLARYSTVLPCLAAPSGSLSGLYLPSFSTNLVAASSQVFPAASRSGPESAPCSCRLLSHQTLLWHHRLGHPSLPCLRGMASRVLVSGLPQSLPPLPPGPAPTCVPCVEGRQRAAPHSSEFPPTEAPLQTLHMDVWGPARVRGQGHERYFLLVVDDYSRYTIVFPLRSKEAESFPPTFYEPSVVRRASARRSRFRPLHSKMGLLSAALAWSWMSLYAAHHINLQPRVSLTETSTTLRWTGQVGDASAFRVWGSRAFVRDLSADKLSSRSVPCVFLGFPPDAPGWQFYHPTSRRVQSSQDVTFDESVPYYRLFPYRTAPLPRPPLFLAPGPPPVDPLPPQGPAPSGAMAAQELRWLTYLLTDLGEPPRSPPVLAGSLVGTVPGGGSGAGRGSTQRSGSGGGPRQQQQRGRETLSPQQLREWYTARQRGGGFGPCTYVLRTGDRTGEKCGGAHPTQRCFGRLTDAWRRQFPEATEIPRWGELSRAGVAIYDLDFDAILSAMYAVSISDEGDCYRCFPPDPGIETAALGTGEAAALGACDAAALGASTSASSGTGESALSGTASASASLTFTLDSGASRSFFRDRTTLTPLSRPVAVSLADPSGGPVLSHFSTVLPCPAAPSGTLSGLYLPLFSTNLVSGADLQDGGVHQFTPACQRVTHCTEASTGRHLATFTHQPGSSLYTLTTPSPPVAVSGRVAASGQVFASASRSLPPLPQGPGPTCVPCVEGRQRATPHSSQFSPTEAPLQTLHMDVWGPARVSGQGHERYFLLVVDDYSRYTTVFPLRSKGDVTEVLIDWIRAARLQLRQSFGSDFPVLRLHSDKGGEFSSGLLGAYYRARGIRQTFTLPDSPQQNGIAERRIGMVMDVARTSMMHAAAPHFLWPFATGKVGDASAFRVWGSRAFVRDLSADKLSPRATPCVFLGFPPDVPGWQFYHPTSRRVLSSQDVTFDEAKVSGSNPSVCTSGIPVQGGVRGPLPFHIPPPTCDRPSAPLLSGRAPSTRADVAAISPPDVATAVLLDAVVFAPTDAAGVATVATTPTAVNATAASLWVSTEAEEEGKEMEAGKEGEGDGEGEEDTRGEGEGEGEEDTMGEGEGEEDTMGEGEGEGEEDTRGEGEGDGGEDTRSEGEGEGVEGMGAEGTGIEGTGAEGTGAEGKYWNSHRGGCLYIPATPTPSPPLSPMRSPVPPPAPLPDPRSPPPPLPRVLLFQGGDHADDDTATSHRSPRLETPPGFPPWPSSLPLQPDAVDSSAGFGGAGSGGADSGGAGSRGVELPSGGGVEGTTSGGFAARGTRVEGAEASAAGGAIVGDARGSGAGGTVAGGTGDGGAGAGGKGGLVLEAMLLEVLEVLVLEALELGSYHLTPHSQSLLITDSLTKRREPVPCPASPVARTRSAPRIRPPPVPGTHIMTLRPSPVPQRIVLPLPPSSSFPNVHDPESDLARAASPTLVDFAATCRLEYFACLVFYSDCPPSVSGEVTLGCGVLEDRHLEVECLASTVPHLTAMMLAPKGGLDVLDIPTPRFYAEAITVPYSSQWQTAMDAEKASWKVKRLPSSPLVFKARYVARSFSQRQGVEFFHTFSPTPKMITLQVLLHVAAQRDYELHSLDFSTTFLHDSLHEEI